MALKMGTCEVLRGLDYGNGGGNREQGESKRELICTWVMVVSPRESGKFKNKPIVCTLFTQCYF